MLRIECCQRREEAAGCYFQVSGHNALQRSVQESPGILLLAFARIWMGDFIKRIAVNFREVASGDGTGRSGSR